MRTLKSSSFLLLLVLAGCVTTSDRPTDFATLARAPLCCQSPAGFTYQDVPPGQPLELDIDTTSPAFEFYGDKSFFRAFALPRSTKPLTVIVEAFSWGSGMFYPGILFLNDGKEPAFTVGPAETSYVPLDLVTAPRLYTTKTVDPKDGWRYFVVYTMPETMKSGRALRIRPGAGPIAQPRSGEWYPQHRAAHGGVMSGGPASPTARIRVTVEEN